MAFFILHIQHLSYQNTFLVPTFSILVASVASHSCTENSIFNLWRNK